MTTGERTGTGPSGGTGADYLYGEDGDDLLDGQVLTDGWGEVASYTGGRGNDTIYGNTGTESYYFNLGDGQDVIIEQSMYSNFTWYYSALDQVVFGPGISAESISTTRSGSEMRSRIRAARYSGWRSSTSASESNTSWTAWWNSGSAGFLARIESITERTYSRAGRFFGDGIADTPTPLIQSTPFAHPAKTSFGSPAGRRRVDP